MYDLITMKIPPIKERCLLDILQVPTFIFVYPYVNIYHDGILVGNGMFTRKYGPMRITINQEQSPFLYTFKQSPTNSHLFEMAYVVENEYHSFYAFLESIFNDSVVFRISHGYKKTIIQ